MVTMRLRAGRIVHAFLAALVVLIASASLIGALAQPASAQDTTAPAIPAAPQGYELVGADDLEANNLPAGSITLGGLGGTTPKPLPPGYTMVQRELTCITVPLGGGQSTQSCPTVTYAVPEGGPTEAPQAPALPEIGGGAPGEGTFGFDQQCESMTQNTGSWASVSGALRKIFANPSEQVCKLANVVSHPGDALQKMWDSAFGKNVKSLIAGVADGWGTMINWWFTTPSPALSDANYLTVLQTYMLPIQGAVLVISIFVACIRVALAQSGNENAAAMDLVRTFVRTITSMSLFGVAIGLAIQVSDGISLWLLSESGGNDLGTKVQAMMIDDTSTWGPGWVLLIALFGMLGALVQVVLLVVRMAFLMVIVGVLPVAAAASGTEMGSQSYEKMRNWAIAFILFKPASAAIMATAFWAADPSSDVTKLQGLILLTVAAVALPALLRVLNVSTASSGSPMALAGMAAGGAALGMAAMSGGTSAAVMGAARAAKSTGGVVTRSQGGYGGQAPGTGGGGGGGGGGGRGGGGGARSRTSSGNSGPARGNVGGRSSGRRVPSISGGVQSARAGISRGSHSLDSMAQDIAGDVPGRPFATNEVMK